jgi:hypothetical protein
MIQKNPHLGDPLQALARNSTYGIRLEVKDFLSLEYFRDYELQLLRTLLLSHFELEQD